MTKVIIAGSRSIDELGQVEPHVSRVIDFDKIEEYEFVLGGADGVDSVAEELAESWDVDTKIFEPAWNDTEGKPDHEIGENQYGEYWKKAGPARNQRMAEYADELIAIWDGESSGTKDMIKRGISEGLDVCVFQVEG